MPVTLGSVVGTVAHSLLGVLARYGLPPGVWCPPESVSLLGLSGKELAALGDFRRHRGARLLPASLLVRGVDIPCPEIVVMAVCPAFSAMAVCPAFAAMAVCPAFAAMAVCPAFAEMAV